MYYRYLDAELLTRRIRIGICTYPTMPYVQCTRRYSQNRKYSDKRLTKSDKSRTQKNFFFKTSENNGKGQRGKIKFNNNLYLVPNIRKCRRKFRPEKRRNLILSYHATSYIISLSDYTQGLPYATFYCAVRSFSFRVIGI